MHLAQSLAGPRVGSLAGEIRNMAVIAFRVPVARTSRIVPIGMILAYYS